jgi:pimeloyl-[acyl-carrier protein] methyl ester esterase
MNLYTQTSGNGPDLVLIHGWGLHGGIWDGLMPLLEPHVRVTRVDLPGHGRSPWAGEATLDAMVAAVRAVVPARAAWLGWSLGGLVAMRAAMQAANRVEALVTVASSPCFMRKPHWQSAMLPQLLDTFADELEQDYRQTLTRFLALQVRGSEHATAVLKDLRETMLSHGPPHVDGLRAGLGILRDTDLRDELASIHCPTLLLTGERDTLVPAGAGQATLQYLSGARLVTIAGAGHAPFISDPIFFTEQVLEFLLPVVGKQHA